MKKGFTLVELMVVLAVFAIIILATSNTLVQVVKDSNQSTVQNNLRQNGEKVMTDIGNQVRNARCIQYYDSQATSPQPNYSMKTLAFFSDSGCQNYVSGFNSYVDPAHATGHTPYYDITKAVGAGSEVSIVSPNVAPCNSQSNGSACSATCTISNNGFTVTALGTTSPVNGGWLTTDGVKVSLTLQQAPGPTRSSYCGKLTLTDTFAPRN